MKRTLKKYYSQTIGKPCMVRNCSQTLYEFARGCLNLYEKTQDIFWRDKAKVVLDRLVSSQLVSGGFDIGYIFNFGKVHKKGWASSPEARAMFALVDGWVYLSDIKYKNAAKKLADWIVKSSVFMDGTERCYIPYCPKATRDVMVYNGTSFASAALGYYIGKIEYNASYEKVYTMSIQYLYAVMQRENGGGAFWYYNDQARDDLSTLSKQKVDYYHQLQQVEVHAQAQMVQPNDLQYKMIESAYRHCDLVAKDNDGILPYLNLDKSIAVWGMVSTLSSSVYVSKLLQDGTDKVLEFVCKHYDFLMEKSWNGEYFEPELSRKGEAIIDQYMIRSDAWVFCALSAVYNVFPEIDVPMSMLRKIYMKAEKHGFSGRESHGATYLQYLIGKAYSMVV